MRVLLVASLALMVLPPAKAQEAVTHGAPEGAAWWTSATARVVGTDRVRLSLRCQPGSLPCRGRVRLTTRRAVRATRGASPRHLRVVDAAYPLLEAGEWTSVVLPIRRAAREYTQRHTRFETHILVRNDADPEYRPFLRPYIDMKH